MCNPTRKEATFSVGSIFGKGIKQKVAETDDFLRLFGMAGHAMVFTSTTLNASRFFE